MKLVKPFVKTCYSEFLLAQDESTSVSPVDGDGNPNPNPEQGEKKEDQAGEAGEGGEGSEPPYLGGLGLKYKFPGDPKKYAFLSISFHRVGSCSDDIDMT